MPEPLSPTREDANFMAIYRSFVNDTSFCCIKGIRMCGNKKAMNHSLCCTSDISKLTLAINVLNLSSKSQKKFVDGCFISLISVIHCDSYFSFLNSLINQSRISISVFGTTPTGTMEKFIYQSSTQPHRVVIICSVFMFSSWIYHTVHMVSHRN